MTQRTGMSPLSSRPGEPVEAGGLPGGGCADCAPGTPEDQLCGWCLLDLNERRPLHNLDREALMAGLIEWLHSLRLATLFDILVDCDADAALRMTVCDVLAERTADATGYDELGYVVPAGPSRGRPVRYKGEE